jgi:hypothetical protein
MIRDYFIGVVREAIAGLDIANDERRDTMRQARKYRKGTQKKPVTIKQGQTDDNLIVNFIGLVVDRANSLLFGKGVDFDLPGDGETAEGDYIAKVWEVNKKHELLIDTSDYGATNGTPCWQIRPNAIFNDGALYPEILCIDPLFLTVKTDPENYRQIAKYIVEYRIQTADNEPPKMRRREFIPNKSREQIDGVNIDIVMSWRIDSYIQTQGGMMVLESSQEWEYDFPPLLHFKNLPNAGSPYGTPDITEDVQWMQDAINRVATSTNKAIRLTAFQRLWGKFMKGADKVAMGMDNILSVDNEKAELNAIDAGSNFDGMIAFQQELVQAMMAIARSADPATVKDKVGQLTNFGLRILYKDALDKLDTKRQLYGEALKELNRRILILNGMNPDPGEVTWKEPLPQNESELVTGYTFDLNNKLASRETIQVKRGYDPEDEADRIAADQKADLAEMENIGGTMLTNFNKGVPNAKTAKKAIKK